MRRKVPYSVAINAAVFVLAVLAVAIAAAAGWVMNVLAVLATPADAPLGAVIVRVAGIFIPPLGGFLGWVA